MPRGGTLGSFGSKQDLQKVSLLEVKDLLAVEGAAMNDTPSARTDAVSLLPLPLAQLYRRACNAKTSQDRHHHAFYLAEATLKLAACLRIGIALGTGLESRSPLARTLESLCLPSIGHWVGFLRDTTEYLRQRPDVVLLPLAGHHEALLRASALPAVRQLAQRASRGGADDAPPVTPEQAREASRQGVLGFFNLLAAYRNQVFGHGAQRLSAFYEELGPLLLAATAEVLQQECLFGGLTLAVARLAPDVAGRSVSLIWQGRPSAPSRTRPSRPPGQPRDRWPLSPRECGCRCIRWSSTRRTVTNGNGSAFSTAR
jgi:hypothetical protein